MDGNANDVFKKYIKDSKIQPDNEDTPDRKTKISTPLFDEKLETPEPFTVDREGGYKECYFNESPMKPQSKTIRDNCEFEITINPRTAKEEIIETLKSVTKKKVIEGVAEGEFEKLNDVKTKEYEGFESFIEAEEHFDSVDEIVTKKRHSVRYPNNIEIENVVEDIGNKNRK